MFSLLPRVGVATGALQGLYNRSKEAILHLGGFKKALLQDPRDMILGVKFLVKWFGFRPKSQSYKRRVLGKWLNLLVCRRCENTTSWLEQTHWQVRHRHAADFSLIFRRLLRLRNTYLHSAKRRNMCAIICTKSERQKSAQNQHTKNECKNGVETQHTTGTSRGLP